MNGKAVPFNDSPRLLGVHLDRTLSFSYHTETVCRKATSRCRALACLATKEWGWQKNTLKKVYISLVRSCLDFAAPAWQPWLSATRFQCLEATQNKSLRIMTGQAKTTPVEALRAEAGVCSYMTVTGCVYGNMRRQPGFQRIIPRISLSVGIPSTVYRGPAGVSRQLFFLTPSRQS